MPKIRRKTFQGYCPKCREVKALTYAGENEEHGIVWLKCRACSETHPYSFERVTTSGRVLRPEELERLHATAADIVEYSPSQVYGLGQKIHHPGFDDVGEVTQKKRTADHSAIVVQFERVGVKTLIEGLT